MLEGSSAIFARNQKRYEAIKKQAFTRVAIQPGAF